MKVVKFVLKVVLWLVVIGVVALLALPLWFGPVGKTAANAVVPGIVKTDFSLSHLSLNPYTARFELGGLDLANPKGYSVKSAAKVGSLVFDAEPASLLTDVVHIEEITLKDVFVSVVSGGENDVLNFTQIQYNVAGGKDKYEAKQAQGEQKAPAAEAAEKPSKKVVIDRLEVAGLRLSLGFVEVPLPSLVLTDIGKESGGATLQEAWDQVMAAVMRSAGVLGDQLKLLGGMTGEGARQVLDAANRATKAIGDLTGSGVKAVGDAAGQATQAVGELTGDGVKAVGDGVKAVGDGAKKALDSIKGLW